MILILVIQLLIVNCDSPKISIYEEYNIKLDAIRKNKFNELWQYIDFVRKEAVKISDDAIMRQLFLEKHHLYLKQKKQGSSHLIQEKLAQLREAIENRYIDNYLIFYDILFIDNQGDIFYTIRRQADYHKNIFDGKLAQTALSKQLKHKPAQTFVDFQNYELSGEPSAFFVEPLMIGSKQSGWYVLQCSINKLNDIFAVEETLGATGEVFLVNRDLYMMTDSRFFAESTILRKHLSEENILSKFEAGEGNKMVIDYRGYLALTSYKVTPILNSEWLLIAKIDEDEIITEKYRRNSQKIRKTLLQLSELKKVNYESHDLKIKAKNQVVVDMDEFKRVSNGEILYTHGISFCTAIIISQKGKFAYLGHVSANDWIYGGIQTDLVRRMLKRIDQFDLVKSEKRNVEITIISPQIPYTVNLIDTLVDWGVFLSQIKLVHDPQARYANLSHNYRSGETVVEWKLRSTGKLYTIPLGKIKSLGELLKAEIRTSNSGEKREY